MGDRANIVIRGNYPADLGVREAVFLYSHWGGTEMPETLRCALERGESRWTDDQYLPRIIFEDMVKGDMGGETGYGISTRLHDNEYDLLVVLPDEQRIVRLPERIYKDGGFDAMGDCASIGFAAYIASDERTWDNLTDAGEGE